jgi:hypothetical protein
MMPTSQSALNADSMSRASTPCALAIRDIGDVP